MSHRIRTVVVSAAAIAAVAASLLSASPAHAEDQRPCISKTEFNGAGQTNLVQADLEKRWEVYRLGAEDWWPHVGNFVAYPRCGFDSIDEAFYGVKYKRDGTVRLWVWYRARGVHASHGPEAG